MNSTPMRVGITPAHTCSYLPEQYEQLIVLMDDTSRTPEGYETLLQAGFRRSGSDIYRPHCAQCTACHSLRIKAITWQLSQQDKPVYYALYEKYINQRHADGSMYPPSFGQYRQFLLCDWIDPLFIELYADNQLIAVAVTDVTPVSLSAMYTFYDPAFEAYSIGSFAILLQLQLTLQMGREYLYLGYQVDNCRKMNYKSNYLPHERLKNKVWEKYTITSD